MDTTDQRRMAALECALRTEGEGTGNSDGVLRAAHAYARFLHGVVEGAREPTATEGPMQADSLDPAPDPSTAPVAEVWRDGRWWMLCDAGSEDLGHRWAHAYTRRPHGDWERAGLGASPIPAPDWLLTIARALGWRGVE